jgi:hypothetical protein
MLHHQAKQQQQQQQKTAVTGSRVYAPSSGLAAVS